MPTLASSPWFWLLALAAALLGEYGPAWVSF